MTIGPDMTDWPLWGQLLFAACNGASLTIIVLKLIEIASAVY